MNPELNSQLNSQLNHSFNLFMLISIHFQFILVHNTNKKLNSLVDFAVELAVEPAFQLFHVILISLLFILLRKMN